MKIAIIGTGIMGSGMVRNFLKNNHEVFIWNRTKENTQSLVEEGAVLTSSPKEATQKADIVIEITANDESSKAVWLGEDGILAAADENKVLITSATISTEWLDALSKEVAKYNFLDMPLTGGRIAAESGNLTMLVGGDKKVFERVKPTLESITKKFHYFGKTGSGMRFKLLLNMIQGIHINALGEVLKVAKENEMDIQAVGEALCDRPGGVITNLAWQCYQNEPNPINFSIKWIKKDLEYAKKLALELETPLLDDVLDKYKEAEDKGLSDKDWTEIMRF